MRYLAPELSITDVFRAQLPYLLHHFVTETFSEGQAARALLEGLITVHTAATDTRAILKDLAHRNLHLQLTALHQRSALPGAAIDHKDRLLLLTIAALAWKALKNQR